MQGRHIEPTWVPQPTDTDLADAAQCCTTFIDTCAAEAAALRWFVVYPMRSRLSDIIMDAITEHGPLTAGQVGARIGYTRSPVEKALRELLAGGVVVVVGHAPTMGTPRIYGLPEGSEGER